MAANVARVFVLTVISLSPHLVSSSNHLNGFALAQFRYQGKSYQNKFDLPLHFECNTGNGEALNQVRSVFHHRYKDRIWSWGCGKVSSAPLADCSWSGYINHWQGPIRFMCPKGKIMAGVDSKHWNTKEDRRWKLKCCSAKDYHTEECELTTHLNNAKAYFEHKASPSTGQKKCSRNKGKDRADERVFVGMVSNWKGNDRRWQMMECDFAKDVSDNDRDRSRNRNYRYRSYRGRSHRNYHYGDKDRTRYNSNRRGCSMGKCGRKDNEVSRDRSHDRSYDRSRDSKDKSHDCSGSSKDRSRDRSRDKSRNRSRDRSRDKSRDRSRDRSRDKSRDRSRDRSRDKSRDKSRDRSNDSRRRRPYQRCSSCLNNRRG